MSTYKPGHIEGKKRVSLYLDTDIYKALKIESVDRGESMSDIAERALRKELGMVTMTWQVLEDGGGGPASPDDVDWK